MNSKDFFFLSRRMKRFSFLVPIVVYLLTLSSGLTEEKVGPTGDDSDGPDLTPFVNDTSPSGTNETIEATQNANRMREPEWVVQFRFIAEGITQGIVGIVGIIGKSFFL